MNNKNNKYVFYDGKNFFAKQCSKLLAKQSGMCHKDVTAHEKVVYDSKSVIVFILNIKDGHIENIENLLCFWEDVRFARIIVLLLGSASLGSDFYSDLFELEVPPAIKERIYFFSAQIPVGCEANKSLFVRSRQIFLSWSLEFKKELSKALDQVQRCLELLD